VLAKEDDNARLDNIVVVYYILVVVVVRESYSKNPLMRLVFVVNTLKMKKSRQKKKQKKTAKAKFCLFVFLLSR